MKHTPATLAIVEKLKEIEGMLDAYRNGWLDYDRKHIRELQAERRKLGKEWLSGPTPKE